MNSIEIRKLGRADLSAIRLVGSSLAFLRDDYPRFADWYGQKVVPAPGDMRMIFLASPQDDRNRFAGAMILKKTREEKKICTLYVHNDFRGLGIGAAFMDLACKELGCRPVITVSELREAGFAPFLQRFGFKPYGCYDGYYRLGVHEVSYNGPIEPVTCPFAEGAPRFACGRVLERDPALYH